MIKSDGTVERTEYLKKLSGWKDRTDVAKVITGIRRCGKSTLMMQFINMLEESGVDSDDILYLNLESGDAEDIRDSKDLNAYICERIPRDKRTYILLDEVQRVKEWERTLNSLMVDYDADVYITGSNAYLLSSELATYISGRYAEIKMLPLSFKEYLKLHPGFNSAESGFDSYLRYGALPSIDPRADEDRIGEQLQGIYNTVLVKDVLTRNGIRNMGILLSLVRFLFFNVGSITNIHTISKQLGVSSPMIRNYVNSLEEAYIIYKAERYDVRGKRVLSSNEKYYAADLGVRNAMMGWKGDDLGKQIENIVYLELRRRGYDVMVGSFRDAEVDFTAFKNRRVEYYQVTRSMISENVSEREIRSLKMISDSYPKTILSLDRIMIEPGDGIVHMNLIDWLLMDDS